LWSQSNWPEDTFTVEQNREDLQHHVEDNQVHSAYGYMIFSVDRTKCFGSLYVNPIQPVLDNYELNGDQRRAIIANDARIDFWTDAECDSKQHDGFEQELVPLLKNWFAEQWKIKAAFAARKGMDRRQEVYREAHLSLIADIVKTEVDGSSVSLLLYN
jgi:hypothetical protein